ncbi:MAG TPA: ATP-binding protein [Chloroflexota bacterium]|nr:ATP-binding protein [Chloroflexota bacterium]
MSLRLRLTLWYLLVLCIGFTVFGAALLWRVDRSTSAAFTRTMRDRAEALVGFLKFRPSVSLMAGAPNEGNGELGDPSLWLRVLDGRQKLVASQGPPLAGVPDTLLHLTSPGLHTEPPLRLFVVPVTRGGHRAATIQVITTANQVTAAHNQLLRSMLVVGGLTAVVAALAGLFLADRALRPVDQITRIAREIGASDLSRRVSTEIGAGMRGGRRDEIQRLATTFDEMLSRLEESNDRRKQLTADAAHELGTPIASIVAGSEIALRHPRATEEYRETLRHVVDEALHLQGVVDDLLLLARADAGRLPMNVELIELDEVCRQAVGAMAPLAWEKGVQLDLQLPPWPILVTGDDMRLRQVLRNLIDNALRHTPPQGRVLVAADITTGGSTRSITLHVRDSGSGLDPAERDLVFERFHRSINGPSLHRAARSEDGSGLGLAICRAIVTAHGGQISIGDGLESTANPKVHGADFTVVLPPARADDSEVSPSALGVTS